MRVISLRLLSKGSDSDDNDKFLASAVVRETLRMCRDTSHSPAIKSRIKGQPV